MIIPATLIALAFVVWPIIGRYAGASGAWVSTLAVAGTLLSVSILSGRELATPPSIKTIAILLAAGLLNGVAVYAYAAKTSNPAIVASTFVVLTSVMMVVWAPILNWALNGTTPTMHHLAGFTAAAMAIYLLG